jgi:predicted GIY-YIG superfamily endonuclease
MTEKRDTYKYHFKVGKKIVYRGVTNNLERREAEHRKRWPNGKIHKVGIRMTRSNALDWEKHGGKSTRNK